MANSPINVQGGENWNKLVKQIKGPKPRLEVGWWPESVYPEHDNLPVAFVAAVNEFGTEHIPERPFFRNGLRQLSGDDQMYKLLRRKLDPTEMVVSVKTAREIGDLVVREVGDSIVHFNEPPNAPMTIKRKGRNDPLINTRRMLRTLKRKVERGKA